MAVHIPLSLESQLEARILMLSANNLLSPASGRPIAVPSQDMVLGNNYLTKVKVGDQGEGKCFSSRVEVEAAYQRDEVSLHAKIKVRGINRMVEPELSEKDNADPNKWKDWTTVGRVLFNGVGFRGAEECTPDIHTRVV